MSKIRSSKVPHNFRSRNRRNLGASDLHKRYKKMEKDYGLKKYGLKTGFKSGWRNSFVDTGRSREEISSLSKTQLVFKNPGLGVSAFRGGAYGRGIL